MIITMKEKKIKEILAQTLGYEMREFNPAYFSLEELEEKILELGLKILELGLNPKNIIENYEEEEKKKIEEEYNKYFGEDEEEDEDEYEEFIK